MKIVSLRILLFVSIATALNLIACRFAIPYLEKATTWPIELIYFISVGGIALLPMFIWSIYMILHKSEKGFLAEARINKLDGKDWLWTIGGFLFLCITSFLIAKVFMPTIGLDARPFFFKNMPLSKENLVILYMWPMFFFFNIFGEELFWRGYIQPYHEKSGGTRTWLITGLLWACWHLPMGLDLILASLPIFFILPLIVQIRKNTSIAIIIHSVFGAFGFLAIAFGGVH